MTDDITTVQDETTVLVTSSLPEAITSEQDQSVVVIQAEAAAVVIPDAQASIATIPEDIIAVTIGNYGAQGPAGPAGPAGAPGLNAEDLSMNFRKLLDEIVDTPLSGDTTYYTAWSAPGAGATSAGVWKVRKLVLDADGDITESGFADGDLLFDNVWDNRLSLVYS
jgi:hypothetical protein